MRNNLNELVAHGSDTDLCDGVALLSADRFGDKIDVESTPHHCLTVDLIWASYGIIENGGFQYLIESGFAGDSEFTRTANAYQAIGADAAISAFQQLFLLFPNGVPRTSGARERDYLKHGEEVRDRIDRKFFSASSQIVACLAKYIRQHHHAIADELDT